MKQRQFFLLLVGVNLILAIGVAGSFWFMQSLAKKKSDQIATQKAVLESTQDTIVQYQLLENSLKQTAEIESIAQKVLPQEKKQDIILADLDKFIKEEGLEVGKLEFRAKEATAKYTGPTLTSPTSVKNVLVTETLVDVSKTQYDNLLKFLKRIETNQRRSQVSRIDIQPVNENDPKVLKATIVLDIYLKP